MSVDSKPPRRWCVEIITRLNQERGESMVGTAWDDDGEPETIVSRNGVEGFGRISMGQEDDGARFAFFSYGWQGFGGGQMSVEPTVAGCLEALKFINGMLRAESARGGKP